MTLERYSRGARWVRFKLLMRALRPRVPSGVYGGVVSK